METRLGRVGLSLALLLSTACAGGMALGGSSENAQRARRAAAALERDDFTAAHDDLSWLLSRCDAGEHRRRALLVLAAAALDPANPMFSPREAARASAAYIVSPNVDEDQLPLARSLHRLAADLGGFEGAPDLDGEGESAKPVPYACAEGGTGGQRSLPASPSTGPTTRYRALEFAAAIRSDSLTALRAQADSLRSELDRITKLLREDIAPTSPDNDGRR
jgi:hypothetical protein